MNPKISFHPFQGRPLFGRPIRYILTNRIRRRCFHPFQGRPLFGLLTVGSYYPRRQQQFPSLSGKTSIRTGENHQKGHRTQERFPSLSGKTSIRTDQGNSYCQRGILLVSIPFREDLYSDSQLTKQQASQLRFPSLSGKTSIRTSTLFRRG